VLTELRRPRPSVRVREFVAQQPLELLFVSTVTFAEIRFGIDDDQRPHPQCRMV
jgi:toxin FitB